MCCPKVSNCVPQILMNVRPVILAMRMPCVRTTRALTLAHAGLGSSRWAKNALTLTNAKPALPNATRTQSVSTRWVRTAARVRVRTGEATAFCQKNASRCSSMSARRRRMRATKKIRNAWISTLVTLVTASVSLTDSEMSSLRYFFSYRGMSNCVKKRMNNI